jgi:hypothetical protein
MSIASAVSEMAVFIKNIRDADFSERLYLPRGMGRWGVGG